MMYLLWFGFRLAHCTSDIQVSVLLLNPSRSRSLTQRIFLVSVFPPQRSFKFLLSCMLVMKDYVSESSFANFREIPQTNIRRSILTGVRLLKYSVTYI